MISQLLFALIRLPNIFTLSEPFDFVNWKKIRVSFHYLGVLVRIVKSWKEQSRVFVAKK